MGDDEIKNFLNQALQTEVINRVFNQFTLGSYNVTTYLMKILEVANFLSNQEEKIKYFNSVADKLMNDMVVGGNHNDDFDKIIEYFGKVSSSTAKELAEIFRNKMPEKLRDEFYDRVNKSKVIGDKIKNIIVPSSATQKSVLQHKKETIGTREEEWPTFDNDSETDGKHNNRAGVEFETGSSRDGFSKEEEAFVASPRFDGSRHNHGGRGKRQKVAGDASNQKPIKFSNRLSVGGSRKDGGGRSLVGGTAVWGNTHSPDDKELGEGENSRGGRTNNDNVSSNPEQITGAGFGSAHNGDKGKSPRTSPRTTSGDNITASALIDKAGNTGGMGVNNS